MPVRRGLSTALLGCVGLLVGFAGCAYAAPARVAHVVVISVDGLRPDMALRGDMPNLRSLMSNGAFTFWAKTTAVSVTLPSHTSMLTGFVPEKHGVTWNSDLPSRKGVYPLQPTIFELASRAGIGDGDGCREIQVRDLESAWHHHACLRAAGA